MNQTISQQQVLRGRKKSTEAIDSLLMLIVCCFGAFVLWATRKAEIPQTDYVMGFLLALGAVSMLRVWLYWKR